MVEWHHRLSGHDFEQTPGDGEGQGSLVCHSPWGHKESDSTEQLNNNIITLSKSTILQMKAHSLRTHKCTRTYK